MTRLWFKMKRWPKVTAILALFLLAGLGLLWAQLTHAPTPILIVGYNPNGSSFIPVIAGIASGPSFNTPPPQVTAYGYNVAAGKYFPLPVDPTGNLIISASSLAAFIYGMGGGTAQAQTLSLTPPVTAEAAGLTVEWKPIATNTAAAPTLSVNGLTAAPITKCGAQPLAPGDLPLDIALVIYTSTGTWDLQHPVFSCPLGYGYTQLASSVAITQFIYANGPAMTLAAGTWAIDGSCGISATVGVDGIDICRFWNTTTATQIGAEGAQQTYVDSSAPLTSIVAPATIVTLTGTTTVTLQAFSTTTGNTLTSNYTSVRAVRVQ
jgi:hypothetical protein